MSSVCLQLRCERSGDKYINIVPLPSQLRISYCQPAFNTSTVNSSQPSAENAMGRLVLTVSTAAEVVIPKRRFR